MKMTTRLLSYLLVLALGVFVVSCDEGVEHPVVPAGCHYDHLYSGDALILTVDGVPFTGNAKAEVNSIQDKETSSEMYHVFDTTVKLTNFPQKNKKVTLNFRYDFKDFMGTVEINGVNYDYVGRFTGDLTGPKSDHVLIIDFTKIN